MRLIDADETLGMFRTVYRETENLINQGETQLDNLAEGFTETAHIIKYLTPTVDAVPVVRCKDCKFSRELVKREKAIYLDNCRACGCSEASQDGYMIVFPEHYCSYGERKEND